MTHGPEFKVKQRIRVLLGLYNAWYHMTVTGGFGKSGAPDFIGIHKGRGFGIEAKAGGNKPTALQVQQLDAIREAGGLALVVNETEGLGELEAFLRNG